MRLFFVTFGVIATVFGLVGSPARGADPVFPPRNARRSMGNLRANPPAVRDAQPLAQPRRPEMQAPRHGRHLYRHPPVGGVYRYPYSSGRYVYGYDYPYDYRYDPYWPGGYYPYPAYHGRYYLPPLYLPAEELYGPQAVKRFMGWDDRSRPQRNVTVILPPGGAAGGGGRDRAGAAAQNGPALRDPNGKALAEAWKYIGYGDAHFGNQKYNDSYLRYRKAARFAPQLADAYFRQGWALMALGRYDLAARAVKRGLEIDPRWPRSEFTVDELYGGNGAAKKALVDAAAKAAEDSPHDPDPLFMLGVHLHFDGQPQRAGTFLGRAKELTRGDDAHLKAFMGQADMGQADRGQGE